MPAPIAVELKPYNPTWAEDARNECCAFGKRARPVFGYRASHRIDGYSRHSSQGNSGSGAGVCQCISASMRRGF